VKRARKFTTRKKQSLEAYFSYKTCHILMSILGPKVCVVNLQNNRNCNSFQFSDIILLLLLLQFATLLNYKILSNTTFTISNMVGPEEEVTIAGNPVEFIRYATTSLPHVHTHIYYLYMYIRTGAELEGSVRGQPPPLFRRQKNK
jgi:hypothetical protein